MMPAQHSKPPTRNATAIPASIQKKDSTNVVSKTQLKAEADAVQAIGKKLLELPKDKLNRLLLAEPLQGAIIEAKRITAHGAIRRQIQYIGRLMRDVDVLPIMEQLAKWEGKHQEENARFHQMEHWRTRLLNEQTAISDFLTQYPHANSQELRTLIRNAHKESALNSPPKSSRALFKLVREIMESTQAL